MGKAKTLIVTVPDMIGATDWEPLLEYSDVDYREVDHIEEPELARSCAGYDYLMLNYDVVKKLSAAFYTTPEVRALSAISADITGMDWATPSAAAENGVPLLNIPHYSTESVAESILAEVLLHSRERHRAYVDEIRGREVEGRKGINLYGRVGAVLGLGSIGTRTAELLDAMGMEVLRWSHSPREEITLVPLPEIFDRADVICICVKTVKDGPQSNVGFVGAELLARCDGSIIVNLANRALVDHDALLPHLESGGVAGYTVERSPELVASDLGKHERVHLPPSNAWYSDESLATLRATWVQNVVDAIAGTPSNQYVE